MIKEGDLVKWKWSDPNVEYTGSYGVVTELANTTTATGIEGAWIYWTDLGTQTRSPLHQLLLISQAFED